MQLLLRFKLWVKGDQLFLFNVIRGSETIKYTSQTIMFLVRVAETLKSIRSGRLRLVKERS